MVGARKDNPPTYGTFNTPRTSVELNQPHAYSFRVVTQCNASEAFELIRAPGNSAPGAPYAAAGTHNLTLIENNPITQTVTPSTRTIVNTTRPGHMFHSGTVTIRAIDHGGNFSSLSFTGEGMGQAPVLNNLLGGLIFGTTASQIEDYCSALRGTNRDTR